MTQIKYLLIFLMVLLTAGMLSAEIIDDDTPVPAVGDWGGPD